MAVPDWTGAGPRGHARNLDKIALRAGRSSAPLRRNWCTSVPTLLGTPICRRCASQRAAADVVRFIAAASSSFFPADLFFGSRASVMSKARARTRSWSSHSSARAASTAGRPEPRSKNRSRRSSKSIQQLRAKRRRADGPVPGERREFLLPPHRFLLPQHAEIFAIAPPASRRVGQLAALGEHGRGRQPSRSRSAGRNAGGCSTDTPPPAPPARVRPQPG